jgi:hypothetical protein
MKKLESMEDLKALFDPSVHSALEQLARDARYIVVYENLNLWSSRFGDRTAVKVGPGCGVQTLEQALFGYLGDLPSQRQYPVAYLELGHEGN